jgi:hypothetical protein
MHHVKKEFTVKKNSKFDDMNPARYSDIYKLIRISAIIMAIAKKRSVRIDVGSLSASDYEAAEKKWIKYLQTDIASDWKTSFKRLGAEISDDGIIVVGSRMAEWLKATWNQTEFILLPPKSNFTRLYLLSMHNKDHFEVEATLAKVRSKCWIPGVRRMIKTIRKSCVTCRKKQRIIYSQKMGTLPLDRLRPSPAFFHTAVDLCGPFTIRDTVKKRTHGKAFGVIFICLVSRGVYLDLTDSYSTDSFMIVLRRFISIHGYPYKMRSDV